VEDTFFLGGSEDFLAGLAGGGLCESVPPCVYVLHLKTFGMPEVGFETAGAWGGVCVWMYLRVGIRTMSKFEFAALRAGEGFDFDGGDCCSLLLFLLRDN
jgi:hypothetical protein